MPADRKSIIGTAFLAFPLGKDLSTFFPIYIEKFNAHMVSINGIYKSFEVVDKELFNKRVLITLENEIIKIEPLE